MEEGGGFVFRLNDGDTSPHVSGGGECSPEEAVLWVDRCVGADVIMRDQQGGGVELCVLIKGAKCCPYSRWGEEGLRGVMVGGCRCGVEVAVSCEKGCDVLLKGSEGVALVKVRGHLEGM